MEDQLNNIEAERARQAEEEEARRRAEEEERRNRKKERQYYIPIRGDKVDEKIADFINGYELDIPLTRQGEGMYHFGQRKIFAKIMNEKLVIRVGGGYMLMSEFL